MGFRLGRTYVLTFEEGTYLHGAQIRMRSAPIGVLIGMEEKTLHEMLPEFLDLVTEWDFEDEAGAPLPITVEAVLAGMERPVLKAVMQAWYDAAMGVSAPLDKPSDDGAASPDTDNVAQSISMDVL